MRLLAALALTALLSCTHPHPRGTAPRTDLPATVALCVAVVIGVVLIEDLARTLDGGEGGDG